MDVAIVTVGASTSTGTQDITQAGFGTPKLALFLYTHATADDTQTSQKTFGVGATDGSTQGACSFTVRDNVSTTQAERESSSTAVIVYDTDTPGVGEASFSAWTTDGVRINWTQAATSAYRLTVVLLAGDEITACDTEWYDCAAVANIGFRPTAILALNHGAGPADRNFNHAIFSLGALSDDGSTTIQKCLGCSAPPDGDTTTRYAQELFSARLAAQVHAEAVSWSTRATSFTSTGFTFTPTGSPGGDDALLVSLASSAGTKCGVANTPTSTGNLAVTGIGFQPKVVFLFGSLLEAEDTLDITSKAEALCMGVATATQERSICGAGQDNVSTTNEISLASTAALEVISGDGTVQLKATLSSMDSDGFTLNFTSVAANAKKLVYLALGEAAAGATGTLGETLPLPALSLSGDAQTAITGTLSETLPIPQLSSSGSVAGANVGTLAEILPLPALAAAGDAKHTGALAETLPLPALAAAGDAISTITGTLAWTLPLPTWAASGVVAHPGALAETLPAPTLSASGSVGASIAGSFAETLPLPQLAADGNAISTISGTMAEDLPLVVLDTSGDAVHVGTLAEVLPLIELASAGAATSTITGPLAETLPAPVLAAAGGSGKIGSLAIGLVLPALSADGAAKTAGQLGINLPLPVLDASGAASSALSGSLAASLLLPLLSASGALAGNVAGSAAIALPLPLLSASGQAAHSGALASLLPLVQLAAAGNAQSALSGSAALTLPAPALASIGSVLSPAAIGGPFAVLLPAPSASAVGYAWDVFPSQAINIRILPFSFISVGAIVMQSVPQGSSVSIDIPVYQDVDQTELYPFLASALRVEVQLIERADKTVAATLDTDTNPTQVQVNTPAVGYVRVSFTNTDLDADPGQYSILLSVVHAPDGSNTLAAVAPRALRIVDPVY